MIDACRWNKRLFVVEVCPKHRMKDLILGEYRRSKSLIKMDVFPSTEEIRRLMDGFWWNKQLITMKVCLKHQMNYMILDGHRWHIPLFMVEVCLQNPMNGFILGDNRQNKRMILMDVFPSPGEKGLIKVIIEETNNWSQWRYVQNTSFKSKKTFIMSINWNKKV